MNAMASLTIDLDNLPLDQQQALYDRLSFKFDRKASATKASSFEREMFDLLGELCREHGVGCAPFDVLLKSYTHSAYTRQTRTLHDVIALGQGRILRKPQKLQLYRMCFGCLADLMIERGIPLSMSTLLNCAHMLQPAIERHFPGYIRAKMLDRVIGLA
jgi:hypothetical protein